MVGRKIEHNLGCCPACRRPFRSVFDYPRVQVEAFEELPPPEAVDRDSRQARARLAARMTRDESPMRFDDGINITPEIAEMLSRDQVRRYFAGLARLVGQEIDPKRLQPPWQADTYFKHCYPVAETRLFLSIYEADDSSSNQGIAEVSALCEGINFGSAGGPSLQIVGPVARIRYQGRLDGESPLLAGIRAGLQQARELGYDVERMDVTASMSEGVCTVYFAPVAPAGTIVAGGDLSLIVDPQTEEVTNVKRGQ